MLQTSDERFANNLDNFSRTISALSDSVKAPILEKRDLSGIIKDFELAYELSWKSLKTYLELQGHQPSSARSVFKEAYALSYIHNEDVWLRMIKDRNETVHTYNEAFARAMTERIIKEYAPTLIALLEFLKLKKV